MNELIKDLGLLINATLIATPPLLLAALGSCFSERSGVVNIGIEGMMTIGAFTGAVMGLTTGNGWIAFLCAGLAGALFGLIHAFACISCHADQTIAGTAINFLGPGLALFLCKPDCCPAGGVPAVPGGLGGGTAPEHVLWHSDSREGQAHIAQGTKADVRNPHREHLP